MTEAKNVHSARQRLAIGVRDSRSLGRSPYGSAGFSRKNPAIQARIGAKGIFPLASRHKCPVRCPKAPWRQGLAANSGSFLASAVVCTIIAPSTIACDLCQRAQSLRQISSQNRSCPARNCREMPRIGSDHWYRCEDRLFAGRLRISILRRSSSDRFGALGLDC